MGIGRSDSARLHGALRDGTNGRCTAGREGRFPGPALSLDRPIALYIVRSLVLERATSCTGLAQCRSDPDGRRAGPPYPNLPALAGLGLRLGAAPPPPSERLSEDRYRHVGVIAQ